MRQSADPRNTIVSVKRFMGRGCKDIANLDAMPYDFVDTEGMVKLRTAQGVKSPVEISADILRNLRVRAEAALGGPLTGAVITVPAYFDDAQRQATKTRPALPVSMCCACSMSRPRQLSPTASTTPPRAFTPSTIWAAAPSISQS
jgi:hypothetical protein